MGNTYECDIIIPKTGLIHGALLGIEARADGLYVQDLTSLEPKFSVLLKLPFTEKEAKKEETKEVPIHAG